MVVNAPVASIEPSPPPTSEEAPPHVEVAQAQSTVVATGEEAEVEVESDETRKPVSFKSSKVAMGLGWLLFCTVVLANSVSFSTPFAWNRRDFSSLTPFLFRLDQYVIVTLAMGGV